MPISLLSLVLPSVQRVRVGGVYQPVEEFGLWRLLIWRNMHSWSCQLDAGRRAHQQTPRRLELGCFPEKRRPRLHSASNRRI
jgi:hypothetical protein